jgi:hypothetical protein
LRSGKSKKLEVQEEKEGNRIGAKEVLRKIKDRRTSEEG